MIKHQDQVLYLTDDDLENREVWKKVDDLLRQYPLYISIDKDVFESKCYSNRLGSRFYATHGI